MGIDIERLGPAAQKQVREELERRRRAAAAKDRQQKARDGPAGLIVAAHWKKNTTGHIYGPKNWPEPWRT